ncbi:MAG: outer membrane beta-barrel protein [Bacteroidetes bacterium]|nr:outer membrane beta-barrel protein [Bacteroidota bacterium]
MKRISYFLVLIFFPFFSQGQFAIGPRIGFHLNKTVIAEKDERENFENSFKPGYEIGAKMAYILTKRFTFQSEIYYSRKSRKWKILDAELKHEAVYHHLDFPLLLRLNIYKQTEVVSQNQYYLKVGPNFSYWLGGSGTLSGGELETFGDYNYKIVFGENKGEDNIMYIEDANRLQVGFDLGAGALFQIIPNQFINVELSYILGHTFLGERESAQTKLLTFSDNLRASHRLFSISLAYLFGFDLGTQKAKQSSSKSGNKKTKKSKQLNSKQRSKKALKSIKKRKPGF